MLLSAYAFSLCNVTLSLCRDQMPLKDNLTENFELTKNIQQSCIRKQLNPTTCYL